MWRKAPGLPPDSALSMLGAIALAAPAEALVDQSPGRKSPSLQAAGGVFDAWSVAVQHIGLAPMPTDAFHGRSAAQTPAHSPFHRDWPMLSTAPVTFSATRKDGNLDVA